MHDEEARQCVGTGCGIAAIASTVKERGHLMLANSFAFRNPAGESAWGGGVGAVQA